MQIKRLKDPEGLAAYEHEQKVFEQFFRLNNFYGEVEKDYRLNEVGNAIFDNATRPLGKWDLEEAIDNKNK